LATTGETLTEKLFLESLLKISDEQPVNQGESTYELAEKHKRIVSAIRRRLLTFRRSCDDFGRCNCLKGYCDKGLRN
jgi:hypothetical protein